MLVKLKTEESWIRKKHEHNLEFFLYYIIIGVFGIQGSLFEGIL